MRVAIQGCGHGTLHSIYASIKKSCEVKRWNGIDLLIIGGDFQVRKYRAIGDFHEYYSGARKAPYLTLFVGGNHEASSHLQELYYGGWVAPNIYYLGAANVVRFGSLRIAGLSGIWKGYNYNKPHFERLPYSEDEIKSLYHVREIDVRKLLLLRTQVDIGISHDWPRGIEWEGDYTTLFRRKDGFEAEARDGTLGSAAAKYVMGRLRPFYWFAAHMHCKFAAVMDYDKDGALMPPDRNPNNGLDRAKMKGTTNANENEIDVSFDDESPAQPGAPAKNNDEIDLEMSDDGSSATQNADETATPRNVDPPMESSAIPSDLRSQLPAAFTRPKPTPREKLGNPPPPPAITNKRTQFLALDKCLPKRDFLQLLDIESSSLSSSNLPRLTYDREWLAILRVFASHDPHQHSPQNLGEVSYASLIDKEQEWVEEHLVKQGKMDIPDNFELTGPVYDGKAIGSVGREQPKEYSNPQTKSFCEMLGIPNWFDDGEDEREQRRRTKMAANA
ncbi:lariat debranching enzyme, partial [Lecanoromycetidae sp. Uapishka_2]